MIALSGLSGAGKSTAAKALEDLGYFVIDNLPAELFPKLLKLSSHDLSKKAFVIDSREAEHLHQFVKAWQASSKRGPKSQLWFLTASDNTLIKRFQETRRPHPLDKKGQGLANSIEAERLLMEELSHIADHIIQTDSYNAHDLKAEIIRLVTGNRSQNNMAIRLLSFGFKYGLPQELDLCFDVRFLENPYFIEKLKPLTGKDKAVQEFVLPKARDFLKKTIDLLLYLIPSYQAEKKTYLTIAVGCTGGRHRSPSVLIEIAKQLQSAGHEISIVHRDIQK